jgi:dTMP kinase
MTQPSTEPPGAGRDPASAAEEVTFHVRLFGSRPFFRLWVAQVVSALGDWLGFLAVAVLATQIGTNPDAAVAVVMAARLIPGFFLAPVAGVLVDRWNRKKVMVACDVGRALVLLSLPFVDTLFGLVVASLLLEVMTLMWAPAKEASVPHLVPEDRLTSANSLSLAAAYGTFPIASVLFTILAAASVSLADVDALGFLRLDREVSLAFYVDVLKFLTSALLISRIALPTRTGVEREKARRRHLEWLAAFHEMREGWHYIFLNPTVRAVNLGLALALIGGGMLVPLGPVFSVEVMGTDEAGFGVLISALGFGGAAGILAVNVVHKHLPKSRTFTLLVYACGACLFLAASFSTPAVILAFVFLLGGCAGALYVIGFTMLHENVTDELRGRTFSALFTLVRICVLLAFVLGPFLSAFLGGLSEQLFDGDLAFLGLTVTLPGVRLTLWSAGLIILGAGMVASHSIRAAGRQVAEHPSRRDRAGEAA